MAHPDLEDGWFKLSHELDAALAVADFRKAERIVLREMFAQIFGPARRQMNSARLSPTDIARRTGQSKGTVGNALRALAEANVIAPCEGGRFRFLKDYERWTRPGAAGPEPRLSKAEVVWAASAPSYALSHAKSADLNAFYDRRTHQETPPDGCSTDVERGVLQSANETFYERRTFSGVPPHPPIEEFQTSDSSDGGGAPRPGGSVLGPEVSESDRGRAEVADWAGGISPQLRDHAANLMAMGFPPARVREAITEAVATKPRDPWRSSKYILGILRRYADQGGSGAELAPARAGAPAAGAGGGAGPTRAEAKRLRMVDQIQASTAAALRMAAGGEARDGVRR